LIPPSVVCNFLIDRNLPNSSQPKAAMIACTRVPLDAADLSISASDFVVVAMPILVRLAEIIQ